MTETTTPIGDAAQDATNADGITGEEARAALGRLHDDARADGADRRNAEDVGADVAELMSYIGDADALETQFAALESDLDNMSRELEESRTAIRNHLAAATAPAPTSPAPVAVPPAANAAGAPVPVATELAVDTTPSEPVTDSSGAAFAL